MLHLATNLTVDLTLNHEALGLWGAQARVMLHKKRGEGADHVLMKLLAYALFHHPGLRIEVGVGQHYKPDLVRLDREGEPVQWVDCGKITLTKADRLLRKNRRGFLDVVKRDSFTARTWAASARGKVAEPERLRVWGLEAGFLAALGALLTDRIPLTATVAGDREHLYLEAAGRVLESPVACFDGTGAPCLRRDDPVP